MVRIVPGYVNIIPYQDVIKLHQQQTNRLLIHLIPAVINLPITVMIICSIYTSLHISLHFIMIFLPTTLQQLPFGNLDTQQTLSTDQLLIHLRTIQNIHTFTTSIKRNMLGLLPTHTTIRRKFQFQSLIRFVVGIVAIILSALCAQITTTSSSVLSNIGYSQTQSTNSTILRHLMSQLYLPLLILSMY